MQKNECVIPRYAAFDKAHREGHWQRTLEHLREKYAEGGYLRLLIPGSPNEAPLTQLREIIHEENRLRSIFESVYAEEMNSRN